MPKPEPIPLPKVFLKEPLLIAPPISAIPPKGSRRFIIIPNNSRILFRSDGRGRCGVYCAANACIEQVIQHGEVDIFQAVKTVRRHRPQLIENMVRIINETFRRLQSTFDGIITRMAAFFVDKKAPIFLPPLYRNRTGGGEFH